MRDNTSGRRSASIVVDPIDEFLGLDLRTDEIGGVEREALVFINRDGATIDARTEPEARESGGPKFQVGEVRAGQTATLFNVQKNDGAWRETFAARGRNCGLRIFGDLLESVRSSRNRPEVGPANSNAKPNPCERRSSRLQDQELEFSPGGGPSQ